MISMLRHTLATLAYRADKVVRDAPADALTHTGQLSMLRRLAGSPVTGENYARADAIAAGNLGPDFSGHRVEF